jgi:hypothetical protein
MSEYKFGITGKDRKALVTAISEILETPSQYLKTPTYAYQVRNLNIDKDGTVSGKMASGLLTSLAERGFIPEPMEETPDTTANEEVEKSEDFTMPDISTDTFAPDALADTATSETAIDSVCIEVPLDGFTPETIDNLCKMVSAKEPLIKKALGADKLPIWVLKDRITFDWFNSADNITDYAKFITQLCKTAKEKKRVTAKPQETFENEKFAMRVWLIGLGLIGKEYLQIRKLMTANLSGNAAWRYVQPDKVEGKTATPEIPANTSADITKTTTVETAFKASPADAAPETEYMNIVENATVESDLTGYVKSA